MYVVSLDPVDAWAVVNMGKNILNLSWSACDMVGKDIAIHADIGGTSKQSICDRIGDLLDMARGAGWSTAWIDSVSASCTRGNIPVDMCKVINHDEIVHGSIVAVACIDWIIDTMGRSIDVIPWGLRGLHWWRLKNVRPLSRWVPSVRKGRSWGVHDNMADTILDSIS